MSKHVVIKFTAREAQAVAAVLAGEIESLDEFHPSSYRRSLAGAIAKVREALGNARP